MNLRAQPFGLQISPSGYPLVIDVFGFSIGSN